jgi:hypothetical protein
MYKRLFGNKIFSKLFFEFTVCHICHKVAFLTISPTAAMHAMNTRNSPPQNKEDLPVSLSLDSTAKAHWDPADEIAFIDYIADHKSEAGDGMKFKIAFWNAAAEMMKAHSAVGGLKTAAGCAAKWDRVCVYLIGDDDLS